ncbi:hypothetical protein NQ166_13950 [Microbacterium sp. zg.Y1090]|uniref:hypothetical protein n=1 Tax=Microbacterium TaxID=33882 RepID=UPI00214CFBC7|nr:MULTISPECIES: hypothetical protein [unclassified Microbacterium]MCR2812249.1 hypothetical protein [Microbacterium sp. zg.Y1084]MCR2819933.1 hypothetical protein [Microbacterium sp. zg.Y1090]MDL5486125.1 hypothetical protein [Microbacterium sp. zg-Y1211]WIM29334.1 hypothetical protein QNO26_05420 [Microbacterium sp. zg-Y1090]
MTRAHRRHGARAGAATAAALLAATLVGCSILPGTAPGSPAPQGTDQEDDMSPTTVRSAVAESDPRVVDVPTVMVNPSGFASVMTIAVALSGDEPVSTDTVVRIAVAALENATTEVDQLTLIARPASDDSRILDLTQAAAGLPDAVQYRFIKDSLQLTTTDPAVIGGAR